MENMPTFANTQMVVVVPHKLRKWWENIKMEHGYEIRKCLGFLTSLIYIPPDRHVIKALIKFWDPEKVVFRFNDFELTPTIEEIGGFTDLKYQGRGMILPHKQSGKKFLKYLGLRNNLKLACLDREWISLDYLFERFGRKDGHEVFHKEFSCSAEKWRKKRPIAFAIALLGTLVFPLENGKIGTCISSIVRALFKGVDNSEVTLVPMIVAEMLRALSKCYRGRRFFEGCNILLQIWAVEHFYRRPDRIDALLSRPNKIDSHQQRMVLFISPVGTEDWYAYMSTLTGSQIQWRYSWLSPRVAVIRGREQYYIELIGLKGLQPYAPIRVLRQFGQCQVIPLRSDMGRSEVDFEPLYEIPRARELLQQWGNLMTIEVSNGQAHCTPEYYAWLVANYDVNSSPQGQAFGFEDSTEAEWARNLLYENLVVTPEMLAQVIPGSLEQYLGGA